MSTPASDRPQPPSDQHPTGANASAPQLGVDARVRPDLPSQSVPQSGGLGDVSNAVVDGSQVAQTVGSATLQVPSAQEDTNAIDEPLPARTPDLTISLANYERLTPAQWARVTGDDLMNRIVIETSDVYQTRSNMIRYYSRLRPLLTSLGFSLDVLTKDVFVHDLVPKLRIYYEQMKAQFEFSGMARGLPEYRGDEPAPNPIVQSPSTLR